MLVPAAGSLSPHAFDFVYPGAPLTWGCNHLRCSTCGDRVHDSGSADGARVYRCRCTSWTIVATTPLDEPARPEVDDLISVYRKDPARFDGRVNPGAAGHALTWWLLQTVAQRLLANAGSAVTRDFARERALVPGDKPGLLLHALEHDFSV